MSKVGRIFGGACRLEEIAMKDTRDLHVIGSSELVEVVLGCDDLECVDTPVVVARAGSTCAYPSVDAKGNGADLPSRVVLRALHGLYGLNALTDEWNDIEVEILEVQVPRRFHLLRFLGRECAIRIRRDRRLGGCRGTNVRTAEHECKGRAAVVLETD